MKVRVPILQGYGAYYVPISLHHCTRIVVFSREREGERAGGRERETEGGGGVERETAPFEAKAQYRQSAAHLHTLTHRQLDEPLQHPYHHSIFIFFFFFFFLHNRCTLPPPATPPTPNPTTPGFSRDETRRRSPLLRQKQLPPRRNERGECAHRFASGLGGWRGGGSPPTKKCSLFELARSPPHHPIAPDERAPE